VEVISIKNPYYISVPRAGVRAAPRSQGARCRTRADAFSDGRARSEWFVDAGAEYATPKGRPTAGSRRCVPLCVRRHRLAPRRRSRFRLLTSVGLPQMMILRCR